MADVFISYCHVQPDAQLAAALEGSLRTHGWSAFLDSQIDIGSEWAREIERHLRASRYFIVLLSEESIRSAMVRQEVELAHRLRESGALRILPVRIGLAGELPYDLGAYLNPTQHTTWDPLTGSDRLHRTWCPRSTGTHRSRISRTRPRAAETKGGCRPQVPNTAVHLSPRLIPASKQAR